jgi:hypothetical protein
MAAKTGRTRGGRVILSLLICIGIAVEWRRSRAHTDMLVYLTPAAKLQGIAADRDGVLLFFSGVPFAPERGFSAQFLSVTSDEFDSIRAMLFDPSLTVHQKVGFKAVGGQLPLAATLTPQFIAAEAPFWSLLAVALLPTVMLLRRWNRQRLRRKRGQCLECGYDLRASTDRCPECGNETADRGRKTVPASA